MIKKTDLLAGYDELIKSGLSEAEATAEIGFAIDIINHSKDKDYKYILRDKPKPELNAAIARVGYCGMSLNPTKSECTLVNKVKGKPEGVYVMPMYQGLLRVALEEGSILAANCQTIFEGDDYEINAGAFKDTVKHSLKNFDKVRKPLLSYCVLLLPGGIEKFVPLYNDEWDKIKALGTAGLYTKWESQFRNKSVLRRALKLISRPRNSKIDRILALDNSNTNLGDDNETKPGEGTEAKKKYVKPALPVLTKDHQHYRGCVIALYKGTHTIESLRINLQISEEMKQILMEDVTSYIPVTQ